MQNRDNKTKYYLIFLFCKAENLCLFRSYGFQLFFMKVITGVKSLRFFVYCNHFNYTAHNVMSCEEEIVCNS